MPPDEVAAQLLVDDDHGAFGETLPKPARQGLLAVLLGAVIFNGMPADDARGEPGSATLEVRHDDPHL